MKKILLISFITTSVFFASCDKLKELTSFSQDFDYKEFIDVPGLPSQQTQLPQGGASESLPRFGIATNSKEHIEKYKTATNLITDVLLSKLNMTITNPLNSNFNYVDTIQLYVSSSASGTNEQLIAYKNNIAKGIQKVDLDVTNINLKEYFILDSMYYRVYAHFVEIPAKETRVELNTTLTMKASLLQ
ncbi:MAG: hypothetical protein R2800_06090 [Flavipsychrobacter sp.]